MLISSAADDPAGRGVICDLVIPAKAGIHSRGVLKIGAGIHWRMDSDRAMLLGEAMALSYLRDKAMAYHEKFTINITKLDGTIATITNE